MAKETRERLMSESQALLRHFRAHLRITGEDLDAELQQCMMAAIASAEHAIGSVILLSDVTLETSFASSLTLRKPLLSVASVKVDDVVLEKDLYNTDGNVLTFDDSVSGEKVEVKYRAGFEPIPADMLAALMLHASSLFSTPLDSVETLPKASANLLRPYRSWGLGK